MEDMIEQYVFCWCFTVNISNEARTFAPVVTLMKRGDATGAWY
jgi:hypothetical protein